MYAFTRGVLLALTLLGSMIASAAVEIPVIIQSPQPVGKGLPPNPIYWPIQDVVAYLAKESGLPLKLVSGLPWARAQSIAPRRHAMIFGMSPTRQRRQLFDFSLPVVIAPVHAVIRKSDAATLHSLADIGSRRIAINQGESFGEAFEAQRDRLNLQEENVSVNRRLKMLVLGRTDMVLVSTQSAHWLIEKRRDDLKNSYPKLSDAQIDSLYVIPEPVLIDRSSLAIPKGMLTDAEFRRLDDAIGKAWRSGALSRIYLDNLTDEASHSVMQALIRTLLEELPAPAPLRHYSTS